MMIPTRGPLPRAVSLGKSFVFSLLAAFAAAMDEISPESVDEARIIRVERQNTRQAIEHTALLASRCDRRKTSILVEGFAPRRARLSRC
jgi:hypothetical protein